jgi:hypothetical protein
VTRGPLARARAWLALHARDVQIALALFFVTVVVVGATEDGIGFTRDEGYYFKAAELYFGWFRDLWAHTLRGDPLGAFSQTVIDKHWSYNHEHPVKEQLGLFDLHSSAFRFPAWLMSGLLMALIYALARALSLSRAASVVAPLLFIANPRAFWHMHLACFDIGVCAAHVWVVLAYWKGRATKTGALVAGLAFGLAIAVKHNVLFAPPMFVLHWLLVEAKGFGRGPAGFHVPKIPLVFFSLAFVGPLVFLAHWPYLWPDVVKRIGFYFGFHLGHEHYPILYFGDLLTAPPFPVAFPFVMSAVTIPVPVLVVMLLGAALAVVVVARDFLWRARGARGEREWSVVPLGDLAREPSSSPALLLLLNAAFPFVLIALPSTPIFGGTKHWMNALPFLCVLGAWALEEIATRAVRAGHSSAARLRPAVVVAVVGVLSVTSGMLSSARVHPAGLASYNALTGFARGAATVGFQRTFWGYEPRPALPLINERAKKSARILFGDTNRDDTNMYKRDGLLRADIALTGSATAAQVSSVLPQGEFKELWMDTLNAWDRGGPDHVVHVEGVPLATITFRD